jgi:hypothetical protein
MVFPAVLDPRTSDSAGNPSLKSTAHESTARLGKSSFSAIDNQCCALRPARIRDFDIRKIQLAGIDAEG